ncbi:MAG: hypothetical protein ABMA02_18940 [Saprospiraceae bacterium]
MTNLLQKLAWGLAAAAAVLVAVVAVAAVVTDFDSNIASRPPCDPHGKPYPASTEVGSRFSEEAFLRSSGWCSPAGILQTLKTLDTANPDSARQNRDRLILTLTEKLEQRIAPALATYHPDTLIQLLHWASRLHDCKDILASSDARVFRIVSRHWLSEISNRLGGFLEKKSSLKYGFKFKYMVGVCQSRGFFPPIGNSNLEKFVINLSEKKYGYLFHRLWNSTGWAFKLFVGAGLAVLLYAFQCMVVLHLGKPRGG